MATIKIDSQRCKGCLLCVAVCTQRLLVADTKLNRRGVHPVVCKDEASCVACGMCVLVCPDCGIEVQK